MFFCCGKKGSDKIITHEIATNFIHHSFDGVGQLSGEGSAIASDATLFGGDGAGGGVSVGEAISVVNFALALDSGDTTDIVVSGVSMLAAFGTLGSFGDTVVPYLGAFVSLAEGDVEGAAVSAASTYLMQQAASTGNVYLFIAAVVITVLAYDPPPRASINFGRNEDGSLNFDLWKNDEVSDELAESLDAQANGLYNMLQSLESTLAGRGMLPNGQFDTSKLSQIRFEYGEDGATTTIRGGQLGANNVSWILPAGDESVNVSRAVQDMVMFSQRNDSWIVGNQTFTGADGKTFTSAVYDPFGSTTVPNVSEAVTLGIWHGGGNVGGSQALVETTAEDFTTDSDYQYRSAAREYRDVLQTFRLSGDLFSGPGASLLAETQIKQFNHKSQYSSFTY